MSNARPSFTGKAVIVKNVNSTFTCEILEALFEDNEKTGGGPIANVRKHGDTCAVITFEDHTVAANVVATREINHKKMNFQVDWFNGKSTGEMRNMVYVTNIEETCDDLLEILFENPAKTGGGPINNIERKGTDSVVITFESPEDANRVVGRSDIQYKRSTFHVTWFQENMINDSIVSATRTMTSLAVNQQTLKSNLKKDSQVHRKGIPEIRKLLMKESVVDKNNQLKHYDFGSPNIIEGTQEKVILVVGATGAGKSTLINGMINYIFGIEFDDPHRFVIITEDKTSGNQAISQTTHITAYTIHYQKGFKVRYTLTIVDTPGFGDTKGIERDEMITTQIKQLFTVPNGISHIDSICLVTQSSLARLTPTQRYVFDSILALFGKDIENNIQMMLTFCDAQEPQALGAIKAAKIPYTHCFKFNNSAIFAQKTDIANDESEGFNAMFWKMGMQSFANYMLKLTELESRSLTMTKSVLEERDSIRNNINRVRQQIKIGLGHLDRLEKLIAQIEKNQALAEANKDFVLTEVVPVVTRQDVPIGQYVTVCSDCHWTCHEDCAIPNDDRKVWCVAMTDENCEMCPGKCHWTKHHNLGYIFVHTTKEKQITLNELKERYEGAKKETLKSSDLVSKMTNEFIALQITVVSLTDEVRCSSERLKEIALKPKPMKTTEYIDILIISEENNPCPGYLERANQLRNVRKDVEWMENLDKNLDPFAEYKKKIEQQTKSENVTAALEEYKNQKQNVTLFEKIKGFFTG